MPYDACKLQMSRANQPRPVHMRVRACVGACRLPGRGGAAAGREAERPVWDMPWRFDCRLVANREWRQTRIWSFDERCRSAIISSVDLRSSLLRMPARARCAIATNPGLIRSRYGKAIYGPVEI